MAQIKHKESDKVLFELKDTTIRETLIKGVENNVTLQGADLQGADLHGVDLNGVNLSEAILYEANLYEANLSRANLSGTMLVRANLSGTMLVRANLSGATLIRANLFNTNLQEGILQESHLIEVNLQKANLSGANLSDANLLGANLSGANLLETNFEGANLNSTNFTESTFKDTIFKEAKLYQTIFGLTDLSLITGLETTIVQGECIIDFKTLKQSPHLPRTFLKKVGFSDLFIDYLPDLYDENALNLYPVFLSHNSQDKKFARKLYEALIEKGVLVWFDEKKMRAGDDIYETIATNIKTYDKMILVCSKNSLKNSWWVNKEIKEARKKEEAYFKRTGKEINIIVPITIDDYVHTKWESPNKNYIENLYVEDFSNEKEFEARLIKLVDALRADRKGDSVYTLL